MVGEVVDKRKITFMFSYSLALPARADPDNPRVGFRRVARDLDNAQAHRVRLRIEGAVHRFLTQLSESMEAAMNSEEFFEKLEASLSGEKKDEDTAELRRDIAKQRRTRKRHKKAARR